MTSSFKTQYGCSKKNMARLYRLAAQILDKYGWRQGSYGSKVGGFCAFGAIGTALRELELTKRPTSTIKAEAIASQYVPGNEGLISFNDHHPEASKKNIQKVFRRIARDLEHGGNGHPVKKMFQ